MRQHKGGSYNWQVWKQSEQLKYDCIITHILSFAGSLRGWAVWWAESQKAHTVPFFWRFFILMSIIRLRSMFHVDSNVHPADDMLFIPVNDDVLYEILRQYITGAKPLQPQSVPWRSLLCLWIVVPWLMVHFQFVDSQGLLLSLVVSTDLHRRRPQERKTRIEKDRTDTKSPTQ